MKWTLFSVISPDWYHVVVMTGGRKTRGRVLGMVPSAGRRRLLSLGLKRDLETIIIFNLWQVPGLLLASSTVNLSQDVQRPLWLSGDESGDCVCVCGCVCGFCWDRFVSALRKFSTGG